MEKEKPLMATSGNLLKRHKNNKEYKKTNTVADTSATYTLGRRQVAQGIGL